MRRRLICRSDEHKLKTFCPQQLLQLVPWKNRGNLWGSHSGHLIHWFDCAKQARLYLIVTWKWILSHLLSWLVNAEKPSLPETTHVELRTISSYLFLFSILAQVWVSSVAFLKFTWGHNIWILTPAPLTSWAAQGASSLATTMLLFNPRSISSGSQCLHRTLNILSSNREQHSLEREACSGNIAGRLPCWFMGHSKLKEDSQAFPCVLLMIHTSLHLYSALLSL